MRYHFTPTKMAKIRKTDNKCWQEGREIGTLIHCWLECKMVQLLLKTVWRASLVAQWLRIRLPMQGTQV